MCFVVCQHCRYKFVWNVISSIVFMLTLSTQVCTECNKFNCIHVHTVNTCIFTCSFYTDSLKKSHKGNSRDTMPSPLCTSHFRCRLWKWYGCQVPNEMDEGVLSRLSTKHQKTTWWAWWRMPTCWPFMQGEWLSSPGISSLHVEYRESLPGWT